MKTATDEGGVAARAVEEAEEVAAEVTRAAAVDGRLEEAEEVGQDGRLGWLRVTTTRGPCQRMPHTPRWSVRTWL